MYKSLGVLLRPSAMASFDLVSDPEDGQYETGCGKKRRRFRPFKAMRNLFSSRRGSSKSSSEPVPVGLRARSHDSLGARMTMQPSHHQYHHHHHHLAGDNIVPMSKEPDKLIESGEKESYALSTNERVNLSLSADSIFSEEPKPKQRLPPADMYAFASDENISKPTQFKNELMEKLKGYHSSEDDGLPNSPESGPSEIMLKKRSASQTSNSNSSLLSVDSSDEDRMSLSNGTDNELSASRTRISSSTLSDSENQDESKLDVDLNVIKRTQSLNNSAALHRISVKPKSRRTVHKPAKGNERPNELFPDIMEESVKEIKEQFDAKATSVRKRNVEAEALRVATPAVPVPAAEMKENREMFEMAKSAAAIRQTMLLMEVPQQQMASSEMEEPMKHEPRIRSSSGQGTTPSLNDVTGALTRMKHKTQVPVPCLPTPKVETKPSLPKSELLERLGRLRRQDVEVEASKNQEQGEKGAVAAAVGSGAATATAEPSQKMHSGNEPSAVREKQEKRTSMFERKTEPIMPTVLRREMLNYSAKPKTSDQQESIPSTGTAKKLANGGADGSLPPKDVDMPSLHLPISKRHSFTVDQTPVKPRGPVGELPATVEEHKGADFGVKIYSSSESPLATKAPLKHSKSFHMSSNTRPHSHVFFADDDQQRKQESLAAAKGTSAPNAEPSWVHLARLKAQKAAKAEENRNQNNNTVSGASVYSTKEELSPPSPPPTPEEENRPEKYPEVVLRRTQAKAEAPSSTPSIPATNHNSNNSSSTSNKTASSDQRKSKVLDMVRTFQGIQS